MSQSTMKSHSLERTTTRSSAPDQVPNHGHEDEDVTTDGATSCLNMAVDKSQGKSIGQEHSFLMDRSDVEQMEQGLLSLLDDFKNGRLHAFGGEFSMEKMNSVRNLQVKLAQLHFELEEEETFQRGKVAEEVEEKKGQEKLDKLMKNLENLCSSLQSLHQSDKE